MNNVIEFPAKAVKDRYSIEHDIRRGLKDSGLSPETINRVIMGMTSFIDILCDGFSFSVHVPANTPVTLTEQLRMSLESSASTSAGCFINSLVTERVKVEVERALTTSRL